MCDCAIDYVLHFTARLFRRFPLCKLTRHATCVRCDAWFLPHTGKLSSEMKFKKIDILVPSGDMLLWLSRAFRIRSVNVHVRDGTCRQLLPSIEHVSRLAMHLRRNEPRLGMRPRTRLIMTIWSMIKMVHVEFSPLYASLSLSSAYIYCTSLLACKTFMCRLSVFTWLQCSQCSSVEGVVVIVVSVVITVVFMSSSL